MPSHVLRRCTAVLPLGLSLAVTVTCAGAEIPLGHSAAPVSPRTADEHLQLREHLDQTVWRNEVEAQRHEGPFVELWDALRARSDGFKVLKEFTFDRLKLKQATEPQEFDLNIKAFPLDGRTVSLDHDAWGGWLDDMQSRGYRIVQTEWHHSSFTPANDTSPARSVVSFVIDVLRQSPPRRASIRGNLDVSWAAPVKESAPPVAETVVARDVTVWVRDAEPGFAGVLSLRNQLETENHWIGVRLYESADGPSPIGAEVTVETPERKQVHRVVTGDSFSSQHSTIVHFGLGREASVDSIEVHWPDGTTSTLHTPDPGQYHVIRWRDEA